MGVKLIGTVLISLNIGIIVYVEFSIQKPDRPVRYLPHIFSIAVCSLAVIVNVFAIIGDLLRDPRLMVPLLILLKSFIIILILGELCLISACVFTAVGLIDTFGHFELVLAYAAFAIFGALVVLRLWFVVNSRYKAIKLEVLKSLVETEAELLT